MPPGGFGRSGVEWEMKIMFGVPDGEKAEGR